MKTNSKKSIFKYKRFWLVFIYILLLIWSGIYRYNTPKQTLPQDKRSVQLDAFDGDRKLNKKIRFAYKEFVPTIQNDKLPVILVHGSPGSAEVFDGLAKLIKDRRLIAVDLPGFGASERDIPDYSISAHAKYLQEFCDKLNIKKAHFAGFSLGGGVILHLTESDPERVASISFISSIGVQEYELFGDYHANHFIHAIQLGFCLILQELTPHFGIFDGVPLAYSRNFYDTDQRPLRRILQKTEQPFLIIHGEHDPLVPLKAAREHARLVPQSQYHELDDHHFFIFQNPEKVDQLLERSWNDVENGTAETRSNADPNRIKEAGKPFKFQILKARGATLLVLFLLLTITTFINEDLAFLLAGIFIAQGRFGFSFAIITCLSGIIISLIVWLLLGRIRGEKTLIFERFGSKNIFTNRNFGFRFPLYFAYGKSHKEFWKQLAKFILSAIIWMLLLIFASYVLASGLISGGQNTFGLILFLIIIYSLISLIIPKISLKFI